VVWWKKASCPLAKLTNDTIPEARRELVPSPALSRVEGVAEGSPVEEPALSKVEGSKGCRRAQPNGAGRMGRHTGQGVAGNWLV